jgi:hypothetical protein
MIWEGIKEIELVGHQEITEVEAWGCQIILETENKDRKARLGMVRQRQERN